MLRLYMHEGQSYQKELQVKTYEGHVHYLIVGQWGRVNDRLTIYGLNKEALLTAIQKTVSFAPSFNIFHQDDFYCHFKRKFNWFGIYKPWFYIKEFNWIITGDFDKGTYKARKNTKLIMSVDKYYTAKGDFYHLEIENPDDAVLCCLIAALIDHYAINKDDKKDKAKNISYA